MLCRDLSAGYARYICPGCGHDRRVPFSCKTRFCPPSAPLRTGSCGKVQVDNWVNDACPATASTRGGEHSRRIVRELVDELYPGVRIGMIYTVHTGGWCGCIMQLAEIWDPKHGHIWMRRWLETHRMRKAARQALERIRLEHHRYRQLAFDFNT